MKFPSRPCTVRQPMKARGYRMGLETHDRVQLPRPI
jgi:hypothetical protein